MIVADHNGHRTARFYFFNVGNGFFEQGVLRGDGDNGHTLGDQRDRAVLQFACRIAFGVNVADFFKLQRALHRQRVVKPSADIEQAVGCDELS